MPEKSGPGARTLVVGPAEAGKRLDVFLATAVAGVSRSQLTRHIAEGAVTIAGTSGTPSRKVRAGEVVDRAGIERYGRATAGAVARRMSLGHRPP